MPAPATAQKHFPDTLLAATQVSVEELTPKVIFLESLDRCLQSGKFVPAFYDRFMASSDEVKKMFVHTDFKKQNRMLVTSLKLAAATAGDLEGLQEIKGRAESHDRHYLNVKPHLYELWRTALIDTARVHDKLWNTAAEDAWKTILGHVINRMIKFY